MYWKQKRYEDARREFQAELANQPQYPQALIYLGDSEMQTGAEKEAEQHLRRGLELDANNRLAHLDLGILLAGGNDSAAAERHLRKAIQLDPSKPDAHYQLGRLLRSVGRAEDAQAEFAKVKELATQEQEPPPLMQVPGQGNPPQP